MRRVERDWCVEAGAEIEMRVEPGNVVRLKVTVRDDLGTELQTDATAIDVIVGFGQILPRVEQALIGLAVGEHCSLQLAPEEAFGEHQASGIVDVDKGDFPNDVAVGDQFEAESDDHQVIQLRVLQVGEEFVQVNMNHVLAGKVVGMDLEVVAIRPAESAEVESAKIRQSQRTNEPVDGLLPAKALLRGRQRR